MRKFLSIFALALVLAACETPSSDSGGTNADGVMVDENGNPIADGTMGPNGEMMPSTGSLEEFIVEVGDRVFFDFDSYGLTEEARMQLDRQYQWLTTYPDVPIVIEGHCDERGTREYNLALGERRANAAYEYFLSLGMAPSRMTVISYGKERPAMPESNEAAWAQNRRAVTVPQVPEMTQ